MTAARKAAAPDAGGAGGDYADFPSAYVTLIETFDEADRIHVSDASGDDATGDGSVALPYQTIPKAMQNAASGDVIIIFAGTYMSGTTEFGNYIGTAASFNGVDPPVIHDWTTTSGDVPLTFIGVPGLTIVQAVEDTLGNRDWGMAHLRNDGSEAYGIWFKRDNGGRTTSYMVALVSAMGGSGIGAYMRRGNYFNCLFEEVNANGKGTWNYHSGSNDVQFNNCTFKGFSSFGNSYTGGSNNAIDCQLDFNNSSGCALSSCTTNATIDGSGHSDTDDTVDGVYSGTYDWDAA